MWFLSDLRLIYNSYQWWERNCCPGMIGYKYNSLSYSILENSRKGSELHWDPFFSQNSLVHCANQDQNHYSDVSRQCDRIKCCSNQLEMLLLALCVFSSKQSNFTQSILQWHCFRAIDSVTVNRSCGRSTRCLLRKSPPRVTCGDLLRFGGRQRCQEATSSAYPGYPCTARLRTGIGFRTVPATDRQTDRQTDGFLTQFSIN